jgi:CheY-like chemotaxis protein
MSMNYMTHRSIRAKEGGTMRSRETVNTTRGGALEGDNTKDDNFTTKEAPASASSVRVRTNTETSEAATVELRPGTKVVVVDDTPVNVKVLIQMISWSTSAPIVSCFDGRSAIDLVASSNREDFLLLIMDWCMPGLCGLTATDSIRRLVKERGGPKVYICMLTADVEGKNADMVKCHMSCEGTVSMGKLIKDGENEQLYASEGDDEIVTTKASLLETKQSNGCSFIDIVAEKPVT